MILIKSRLRSQVGAYTFNPQIDAKSRKLENQRGDGRERHDILYQQACHVDEKSSAPRGRHNNT